MRVCKVFLEFSLIFWSFIYSISVHLAHVTFFLKVKKNMSATESGLDKATDTVKQYNYCNVKLFPAHKFIPPEEVCVICVTDPP